jgi:release factor glutamine methyltransferase
MTELEAHGIRYRVERDVYDPSDDTFLLIEAVRRLSPGRFLDVGTGSGLVAIAAARAGHDVTATDRSPEALRLARANARLNGVRLALVRADLLRGLQVDWFEAVVFNPPYLPTAAEERLSGPLNAAFDGGPDGLGVTRRFLEQLPPGHAPVLLVATSLQPAGEWESLLARRGLRATVVSERALPHERLRVLRLAATRKG